MLRANGVDSLLKLLQQFLNSKKIYYYVLGALTLLTGEGEQLDLEVCEVVRRRLGLTLIVDSVESFQKDPFHNTPASSVAVSVSRTQFTHSTISATSPVSTISSRVSSA